MMSDRTPSTLSCVGRTECDPKKHSRMRVERAGPDVAIHDTEGRECQGEKAVATMHGRRVMVLSYGSDRIGQPLALSEDAAGRPKPGGRVLMNFL